MAREHIGDGGEGEGEGDIPIDRGGIQGMSEKVQLITVLLDTKKAQKRKRRRRRGYNVCTMCMY